jgi:hypothetical protein
VNVDLLAQGRHKAAPRLAQKINGVGLPSRDIKGLRPPFSLQPMTERLNQQRLDGMKLAAPHVLDLLGDIWPIQFGILHGLSRSAAA